jgi:hypothetical protein
MPDLAIARHYKADVRKIEELRSAATHQRMSSKVDLAKQAAQLLNTLLSKLTPYAGLRKQLSDTGKLMGSVEIAMYPENPTWGEKMAAVRGPFWALQKRWSAALERTITADTNGLAEETQSIAGEADRVVKQAREIIGDKGLY